MAKNRRNNRKGKNVRGPSPLTGKRELKKTSPPPSTRPTKPVFPGAKGSSYSDSNPVVTGAAAKWYKSVLNPAHARSYGCVGIPDENRNPTAVLTGRFDVNVTELLDGNVPWLNTFDWVSSGNLNELLYRSLSAGQQSTASKIKVAPRPVSDPNPDAVGQVYLKFTRAAGDTETNVIKRMDMFMSAHTGLILRCYGNFKYIVRNPNYNLPGSGTPAWGDQELTDEVLYFGVSSVIDSAGFGQECRPISCSVTVNNVTAWANLGGYYTGGHIPWKHRQDLENPTFRDKVDGEVYWLMDDVECDNFATYTGQTAAGAYSISRPRNVHAMCWFGSGTFQEFNPTSSMDPRYFSMIPWVGTPDTAWDIAFVKWYPTAEKWSMRLTTYENLEVMRSYQDGGSDSAPYDKIAMEHLMALLDVTEFMFQADANDMKKVMGYIKKTVKKYRDPIIAAMGVAGSPRWLNKITAKLIDHMADT